MPRISTRKRPKIPAIPGKTRTTKLAEAYERIGVTEEEVNAAPKITHILRELPGKTDKAIEFLRGSSEPDARKWLSVYDSVTVSARKIVPFEAFCVAAGITTKRMLEVITGACFEQSDAVAALLSKSAKPQILQKSIKLAQKPKQWEDRKMIMQHEGYAPIPKTQIINVGHDINTDNRIQSVIAVGELASIEPTMAKIADRFNQRLGVGNEIKRIPEVTEDKGLVIGAITELNGSGVDTIIDSSRTDCRDNSVSDSDMGIGSGKGRNDGGDVDDCWE